MIRAVRNSNPGNLEAGDQWQGLMPRDKMTPEQKAETRFAVFLSPKWGFRALGVILLNYEKRHGIHTIRDIINRWAPKSENNTDAYIKAVCKDTGFDADEMINLHSARVMQGLCKAIATHECGGFYFNDADLIAGVALAETVGV